MTPNFELQSRLLPSGACIRNERTAACFIMLFLAAALYLLAVRYAFQPARHSSDGSGRAAKRERDWYGS